MEVMTLYCNTNKVQNTKGDVVPAPVFKSTDAAMLRSQCPKLIEHDWGSLGDIPGGPPVTAPRARRASH